ncbi:feruloyl-CoA synthase [Pseudenhygromyxa sp. WMMC2535]|uniref:feruloyl-CoA synthase n=1 Tax=Pseudenhygromyxa sp. WMMC2535 TaxID=2712867 RepID=UPI0015535532|nr:feruloyl-CoA synthase [Pseudenhygromyxa sp. WMMC2535]NVB40529.1 feruloyl-CoA synthase [Pseudenhygromyxa sp. WMMC2535]
MAAQLDPKQAAWLLPHLAEPAVRCEQRSDGAQILSSLHPLGEVPRCLGDLLVANAARHPERVFLGERSDPQRVDSAWRSLTWGEALPAVRALAQALLELGAGPERPLLLLSGNAIAHALLSLAAMHVGVPATPVSVAYSLMSRDFAKLRLIAQRVTPGVVFVERHAPYAAAITAAGLDALPLITAELDPAPAEAAHRGPVHTFARLRETSPSAAVDEAFAALGPDSVAKILFTSGSTGVPKGVINTQRMLCSNQAALAELWPFLAEDAAAGRPPVLCDWLPWNHTFGANFNFNMAMMHAGSLWIDGGKPIPGAFEATLQNLRERAPTLYFNVPRGFELLIAALEADPELRDHLFSRLRLLFYAGAALPQNLWARLEALSVLARGARVMMVSAWGSTETAPCSTVVHWPIEHAGVIGNPMPGTQIAMVPSGDKLELRVRGPNVTPGYWRDPELSAAAFDESGFYRIGDAGKLADLQRPERGVIFDGRVAEDFKLSSGTWVHVGKLRLELIAACEPLISDCVIAGHDRRELGVLLFPNLAACRARCGLEASASAERVLTASPVREAIASALEGHNAAHPGSSARFERALLLATPPSIDSGEITDKGYINQRAVLSRRECDVRVLFGDSPVVIRPKE